VNRHQKREAIEEYLQKWQRVLCLQDWQVCSCWPPEYLSLAEPHMKVDWPPGYRTAQVFISPRIFGLNPTLAEQCACHEMLHLVFAPVAEEIGRLAAEDSEIYQRYSRVQEAAIDSLSIALCKALEAK